MRLRLKAFFFVSLGQTLKLFAQVNFQNLDFESANPIGHDTSVAAALPGWNAYIGGHPSDNAFYNDIPLKETLIKGSFTIFNF